MNKMAIAPSAAGGGAVAANPEGGGGLKQPPPSSTTGGGGLNFDSIEVDPLWLLEQQSASKNSFSYDRHQSYTGSTASSSAGARGGSDKDPRSPWKKLPPAVGSLFGEVRTKIKKKLKKSGISDEFTKCASASQQQQQNLYYQKPQTNSSYFGFGNLNNQNNPHQNNLTSEEELLWRYFLTE